MFVLNDVRHDARVRREAATLAQAGWRVTIVGRPTAADATAVEREDGGGFEIVRVPIPGRLRRWLLGAGGGRASGPESPPAPGVRRGGLLGPVVRAVRRLADLPIVGSLASGLDLLLRWRLGVEAWASAAAAAAPAADAWHAHDLTGLPAALAARRRHGGRLVYDAHELFTEAGDTARRPAWARAALRRLEARGIAAADAVVTVNAALAVELAALAAPATLRRLVVVHNAPPRPPVEASDVGRRGSPLRSALSLDPGTPLIVYHGSFAVGRGVEVVAAALADPRLADVHGAFIGSGSGAAALAEAARTGPAAGRIHVLPPVMPDAVVDWIAGSDVGVMPIAGSTKNHRLSTPNKLFECLAAGLPIVAGDLPGIRSIIAADAGAAGPLGLLVDPLDPAAVAAAVRILLDEAPAERAARRDRARRAAAERWNWETESAGLLELYASFASPRPGRRVTLVLPTDGAFDSRSRRLAASLAGRGHEVRLIARARPDLPTEEWLHPRAVIRRLDTGPDPAPTPAEVRGPRRAVAELGRMIRVARQAARQRDAALVVAEPADLVHAMGFLALPTAMALSGRDGVPFVYDARDLYAEARNIARAPGPVRVAFADLERRWARRAARVLTVNDALAEVIATRWRVPRPAVVHNCPALAEPDPAAAARHPLRSALGVGPAQPVVLYHGGLYPERGIEVILEALTDPRLAGVQAAFLGYGPLRPVLEAAARTSALAGRVHVLEAVPPERLAAWVADADAGLMAIAPTTLNHRLVTPNKLFECLAVGVPVVAADLPGLRAIVGGEPATALGELCDPTSAVDVARAVAAILARVPAERAELRERCRAAARSTWNWEAQLPSLLAAYAEAAGGTW
jgi:glycosyltransferase involved in cell wall biosynthesis